MKHYLLLAAASFFILALPTYAQERKNVLFIMVDDWNHWISPIGYYDQAITPNVNALANQGVLFADASSPSPVCNPSRNAVLSGVYPFISGITSNSTDPDYGGYIRDKAGFEDVVTLNQHFKESGYYTYAGGKIYHPGNMGDHDTDPDNWTAFTTQSSGSPGGDDYAWASDIDDLVEWNAGEFDIETSGDRILARDIAGKISNYDSEEPFFMALGLFRPHLPWKAHKKYFDMYDPDTLDIPQGYLENDQDDILASYNGQDYFQEVVDEGQWKNAIRAYLANMTFADENVGIVMDALNNSAHADNTIIVFMGDHGWHLGEKDRLSKHAVFDQAARTTYIIYDPDATENGKVCNKVVNIIDSYPTLINICGLDDVSTAQGNDLSSLLQDVDRTDWDVPNLFAYRGDNILKTNTWRFVDSGSQSQLYDMVNDPYEWTNLYSDPQYADVVTTLRDQIDSIITSNSVNISLSLDAAACNEVILGWNDVSVEDTFQISRKNVTAGETGFTVLSEVAANVNSYVDATVAINTAYEYKITAVYGGSAMTASNTASVTSLNCANGEIVFDDISDLTLSYPNCNTVALSWSDVGGEDEYRVRRKNLTAGETSYTIITDVPANTTSYSDISVEVGIEYLYMVRAMVNNVSQNISNTPSITTTSYPDCEIADIENLTLSLPTCNAIQLNWEDVLGEDEYRIRRINITAGEADYVNIADVPANTILFIDENVDAESTYQYMVRALVNNTSANLSNTPVITATSECQLLDIDDLVLATNCTAVELTWTDIFGDEGYRIRRQNITAGETEYTTIDDVVQDANTYVDTNVDADSEYSYTVRALVDNTAVTNSNKPMITVTDVCDIPDIEDLVLTNPYCNTIVLDWSDVNGEDEYRIRRINITAGETEYTNIADVTGNVTTYTDINVDANSEYQYMVRALIGNVSQNLSNTPTIMVASTCEIVDIADLTLDASACNEITLNWSDIGGEDEYRIRRINITAGETGYTNITDVPANSTAYVDTDISDNSEYQYMIRALINNVSQNLSNTPKMTSQDCGSSSRQSADNELVEVLEESQLLVVYPNPVRDVLYIEGAVGTMVEISDVTGKILIRTNLQPSIEVSGLNTGIYYLQAGNSIIRFLKN